MQAFDLSIWHILIFKLIWNLNFSIWFLIQVISLPCHTSWRSLCGSNTWNMPWYKPFMLTLQSLKHAMFFLFSFKAKNGTRTRICDKQTLFTFLHACLLSVGTKWSLFIFWLKHHAVLCSLIDFNTTQFSVPYLTLTPRNWPFFFQEKLVRDGRVYLSYAEWVVRFINQTFDIVTGHVIGPKVDS